MPFQSASKRSWSSRLCGIVACRIAGKYVTPPLSFFILTMLEAHLPVRYRLTVMFK